MNKKDIQKRVLQYGEPLSLDKFSWCEDTKTFSSSEYDLVLDFNDVNSVTFNTGSNCTFDTGSNCTFDTGSSCIFNTGSNCTFDTGSNCTFDTGSSCIFNTSSYCTFDTGPSCTFKTGSECVVIRRDLFEIIELKKDQTIKLKGYKVKGYDIIEEPKECSIKDKVVEIDGKKYKLIEV